MHAMDELSLGGGRRVVCMDAVVSRVWSALYARRTCCSLCVHISLVMLRCGEGRRVGQRCCGCGCCCCCFVVGSMQK